MPFWRTLLMLLGTMAPSIAYNLSPTPNHILEEPPLVTNFPSRKNQSSYFGYSINLRSNSIIVGAPRAAPRLESQRNILEPGAIYKCDIQNSTCHLYTFDKRANVQVEGNPIQSEFKDEQWLGASMDGSGRDDSKFVVCASRNFINYTGVEYFLHGSCHWVENTTDAQPQGARQIAPLRNLNRQVIKADNVFLYMMAQMGLSVHVTEDGEEILIGAVGIYNWMGTVVRYRRISIDIGLSRRETSNLNHQPRSGQLNAGFSYASDIPNPETWNQQNFSYFGYAVSSGFFHGSGTGKLLYIASAPRIDEVYLFDIIDQPGTIDTKTIQKFWTFKAPQFGEYFGSTLLVEDFNGDGLPDLAIGAPYHRNSEHDNGAVYIYTNLGKLQFTDEPIKITTDYELNGKFGLTLGKIGDINLDGYNDLAVGAPYEGDGAVYIFLGSREGLQRKPVQKLTSPGGNHLFGYSISRGVDIDANGYPDIAVGAPENETVFIYRTYPVVKVIGSLNPQNRELDIGDTTLKFNSCWNLQSPTTFPSNVRLSIKVIADAQYGRITFPDGGKVQEFEVNVSPQNYSHCRVFDVAVESRTEIIFKPIDLEMSWKILDNTPQEGEFCQNCVYLNPNEVSYVRNQVVFNTGCKNTPCRADLRISGNLIAPQPYILGSKGHFRAQYEITNHGEAAYLPKITIEKSPSLSIMKILPNCLVDSDDIMTCVLSTEPLLNGQSHPITFGFDPSTLEGSEAFIIANVSSTGEEENPEDNTSEFTIAIQEMSEIEIVGQSSPPFVAIRDRNDQENITHALQFYNHGPTVLPAGQVKVIFDIPVSLLRGNRWINFISFGDITAIIHYKSHSLNVVWTQNDTFLIQNPIEYTTSFPAIADDLNAINYDASKLGFDLNMEGNHDNVNQQDEFNQLFRKKRNIETTTTFNPYTLGIKQEYLTSTRSLDEATFGSHINKTIFLDCNQEDVECIRGTVTIPGSVTPRDAPIVVKLTFPVDLQSINSVLDEYRDSLVLRVTSQVTRDDDEAQKMIKITETPSYTHFVQDIPQELQIWVIIVSVIGGLLLLTIITYILYRLGFFKREKKAEIARLVRESQIQAAMESEDED